MSGIKVALIAAAALALVAPVLALPQRDAAPLAEELAGTVLTLVPRAAYESAALRIAGPEGYEVERRFSAGAVLRVDLLRDGRLVAPGAATAAPEGGLPALADGRYRYDLRLTDLEGETRQIPGLFFVDGGQAVSRQAVRERLAGVREELATADRESAARAAAPELAADDYLLVGDALNDAMTYMVLDSDNPAGSTLEYWSLVNQNGDFSIQECQVSFPPDCQRSSLFMGDDSSGRVGIGTTAPNTLSHLHVRGDTTGLMALEEGDTGAAMWVGPDDGDFLIDSISPAGRTLLSIDDATGNVGIGRLDPLESLHVFGNDGATRILVQETSPITSTRQLLKLENNGGPFFIFTDSSLAQSWSFAMAANGDFIQSQQQSPGVELRLTAAGNLTIEGSLTEGSSREIKEQIEPVDGRDVLARVAALPLATWSYRADEERTRHMGPMAEDFHQAFGLGATPRGIAPLDTGGVALAAIQGLHVEVAEKERRIAELEWRNAELAERLERLERAFHSGIASAGDRCETGSGSPRHAAGEVGAWTWD